MDLFIMVIGYLIMYAVAFTLRRWWMNRDIDRNMERYRNRIEDLEADVRRMKRDARNKLDKPN